MKDILISALAIIVLVAPVSVRSNESASDKANDVFVANEGASGTDTNLESLPLRALVVPSFDISGFKLGMSLNEANRVAKKQGFQAGFRTTNYSFEGRALLIANNRLSKKLAFPAFVPETSNVEAKGERKVRIDWLPTAQGIRITRLSYNVPTEGNNKESIVAQLVAKYGKPTKTDENGSSGTVTMRWCSAGETDCSWFGNQLPMMEASVSSSSLGLGLSEGHAIENANERAIAARADELSRGNAKPLSF